MGGAEDISLLDTARHKGHITGHSLHKKVYKMMKGPLCPVIWYVKELKGMIKEPSGKYPIEIASGQGRYVSKKSLTYMLGSTSYISS